MRGGMLEISVRIFSSFLMRIYWKGRSLFFTGVYVIPEAVAASCDYDRVSLKVCTLRTIEKKKKKELEFSTTLLNH